MKAVEYAERWRASGKSIDELGKIVIDFIFETKQLMEARGTTANEALVAVIREVDQKWRCFAEMFPNELNLDGFKFVLLKRIPPANEIADLIWPNK